MPETVHFHTIDYLIRLPFYVSFACSVLCGDGTNYHTRFTDSSNAGLQAVIFHHRSGPTERTSSVAISVHYSPGP